ncbi:hypothetical protein ACIOUE_01020 [Streptomyces xanthochromogenes]|uniref:hypothetical protein n=1 Tax=Streptomyces xanthochromogenes TaxID=67384 RepID=UPI00381DC956
MNPINIAKGLLDKWDQVKDIDHELADSIKADLTAMKDDVLQAVAEMRGLVDPATVEIDGKHVPTPIAEEIRETGRRIEAVTGSSGPKRNTAAAKAPNKAD